MMPFCEACKDYGYNTSGGRVHKYFEKASRHKLAYEHLENIYQALLLRGKLIHKKEPLEDTAQSMNAKNSKYAQAVSETWNPLGKAIYDCVSPKTPQEQRILKANLLALKTHIGNKVLR